MQLEQDNWFWELLRFDEFGLPASWNFIVPDKLIHALTVFGLVWLFSKWFNRHISFLIGWGIMMILWELIWDGCFRYGVSIPDMIANTVGGVLCWWWLGNPNIGQEEDL